MFLKQKHGKAYIFVDVIICSIYLYTVSLEIK